MPVLTLSDLRTKVYGRIENNSLFYSTYDVDRRINEGIRNTNLFCGWSQGKVGVGLTVATRVIYRAPAGMLYPMKVYLDGGELLKDSVSGLSNTRPAWIKGQGQRPAQWLAIGLKLLAIFPADQTGGRYLETWGVTEPAKLVNASDTMELADEFEDLIVEYAYINLVLKEGGKVFQDAARLYQPWLKKMKELQRWEGKINPRFWIEAAQAA